MSSIPLSPVAFHRRGKRSKKALMRQRVSGSLKKERRFPGVDGQVVTGVLDVTSCPQEGSQSDGYVAILLPLATLDE